MAVEVFKDGESFLVEPMYLQDNLNAGYFLTLEESLADPVPIEDDAPAENSGGSTKGKASK